MLNGHMEMDPDAHPKFEMEANGPGGCVALETCTARRLARLLAAATRAPDNYVAISLGPAAALLCCSRALMLKPPIVPSAPPQAFEYIGVSRVGVQASHRRQRHMVALLMRVHEACLLLRRRLAITEVHGARLAAVLTAHPSWEPVTIGCDGKPESWVYAPLSNL